MFEHIHALASRFVSFSEKEKRIFEQAFTYRQVPKKFVLVEEGKVSHEFYFINKGLLRLYYTKEGEEITGFLFKEHLFAGSYDSFLRQSPSQQNLEALEDSDLLAITHDALEELYTTLPSMNVLARKIAEQRFINAQQVLSSFLLDSPEERYLKFEHHHKDLMSRVPQHIIASYLGITPVSLSRIRNRLSKQGR